ncbi:MAG TPA: MraY family glycosyltransferase [Terriglobales bacterium]|nr:MraY family glycosyltransferase [Terriglobales bacterium]
MPTLITTGLLAFLLSLVLTPLWRRGLRRWPAAARREGRGGTAGAAVPRLGGVAVMLAAGLALALPAWLHWGFTIPTLSPLSRQLAGPVLLVLLVGAADDWFGLQPLWKFAGQGAAALWVMALGIRVEKVFHHTLPLPLAVVITLVWLVGCSNAFNLIDGLDGLATGLALFATGTVLAHAVLIGEPALALVMGVLFGSLSAFLLFNFPPASIYLGDAGSLSIGFLLGCMALAWANKATTMVGLLAPFFALLVPMLDTGVALARRALTRQPLLGGDVRHIHHRLLRRGLTPRNAVFVLYAVAGLGAVFSLIMADMRQRHSFELVILLFVVLVGVGVQQLGYAEFSEVGRLLRRGTLDPRKSLQAQVALRHWSEEIGRAGDYQALWECLRQAGEALDFHGLEFRAGTAEGPRFSRRAALRAGLAWPAEAEFCGWTCRLPLGEAGKLGLVVYWRALSPANPGFVDDLAGVLATALAPRLEGMNAALAARGAGASH